MEIATFFKIGKNSPEFHLGMGLNFCPWEHLTQNFKIARLSLAMVDFTLSQEICDCFLLSLSLVQWFQ